MRRASSLCALVLLLAPLAIPLATPDGEDDALRCAIACGHAAASGGSGAACCPMSSQAGGLSITSCPEPAPPMLPAAPTSQPALLASVRPLEPPGGRSPLVAPRPDGTRDAAPRPPDHVPLLLS